MIAVCPRSHSNFGRANFFDGLLGANIIFSDEEHYAVNKLEGVIQQQAFHFRIVSAAPVFSREKRPSNFDLGFLLIVPVEPCRPDDLLNLPINDDERTAAFQGLFEENFEYVFSVTIVLRMLFPDERIRRDREQFVPIVRRERPQFDQFAFQMWLKIECHPTTNSHE